VAPGTFSIGVNIPPGFDIDKRQGELTIAYDTVRREFKRFCEMRSKLQRQFMKPSKLLLRKTSVRENTCFSRKTDIFERMVCLKTLTGSILKC